MAPRRNTGGQEPGRLRRWLTRRRLLVVAGVGVGAIALGALPAALRKASFFRVRRVDVLHARYLSGPDVVQAMALEPGASLFDSTEPFRRRVLRIPGVRSAEVGRRWPGTLVVRIQEAEPVALTPARGGLALLDARGRVLPFDPTRAPADLPLAPADPLVARLVGRIKDAEPALFARIHSAARERDDVVLQAADVRLRLRGDATAPQLRALVVVMGDLARKGRRYRELDARFIDRVFVRGGTT